MDYLHKTLKWVDYQRHFVAWIAVTVFLLVTLVGCPAQVSSLQDPGVQVNRYELDQEVIMGRADLEMKGAVYNAKVTAFNASVEAKYEEMDAKDAIRADAYNFVGEVLVTVGAAAGIPPIATNGLLGLIGVAGGLFGVATKLDNRRKDKKIAANKKEK